MTIYVETGVRVPMRDGVELAADVYLPEGRGPFPALLQRTPYGKGAGRIVDFALDHRRAVTAGYAVVVQDVRGRYASEGAFRPFFDDGADGADSVAWTSAADWCDGRVGMAGGSYGGAAQWRAAGERPPALAAIAPFVAPRDCYDRWVYRDGVFELGFNLHWTLRNVVPPAAARLDDERKERVLSENDRLEALYRRTPLLGQLEQPELAPHYEEWLQEPTPTGRWDAMLVDREVATPALSIGGWYDVFQQGTLDGFAGSRGPRRLVMGPWAHSVFGGAFAERSFGIRADSGIVDLTALQLRWFDRWVRGVDNGADRDAAATVFVTGADYWRDEKDWPPDDAVFTDYFLHSSGHASDVTGNGALSTDAPGDEAPDVFTYDPGDPAPTVGGATFLPGLHVGANAGPRDQWRIERRDDVLCYTTAPLTESVEVAGPVRAALVASSSALDTDLFVTLADVGLDGRSFNVADGIARARYRISRTEPSLLKPETPFEIAVDLGGCAHVFRRGHCIRVNVTGGSFPRFERNPQTGRLPAEDAELRPAAIWIHHDRARSSRVVLPLVQREQTGRLAA